MSPDLPVLSASAAFLMPRVSTGKRDNMGKAFVKALDDLIITLWRLLSDVGRVPKNRRETADIPRLNPAGCLSIGFRSSIREAPAFVFLPVSKGASRSTDTPSIRRTAGHQPNSSTIDGNPIQRPNPSPPTRQSFERPQPRSSGKPDATGKPRFAWQES